MTINMTVLFEKFGFNDVTAIAERILNRVAVCDGDDITDNLLKSFDDELIYTADRWAVMAYYCTPETADYNTACDEFIDDLFACLNKGALINDTL